MKDSVIRRGFEFSCVIVLLAVVLGGLSCKEGMIPAPVSEVAAAPLVSEEAESPSMVKKYQVAVGEIAVVDMASIVAEEIPGKAFAWAVHPEGTAFVSDSQGKILYIAHGKPTEIWIFLAVCGADPYGQIRIKLTVGDGVDPEPEPFGFVEVVPALLASVTVANKKEALRQFAVAYETTTATTIVDMVKRVQEKNKAIMGDDREAWRSFWVALGQEFVRRGVKSLSDYRRAFLELAEVFKQEASE